MLTRRRLCSKRPWRNGIGCRSFFPSGISSIPSTKKLLAKWHDLKRYVAGTVHFAYLEPPDVENSEDLMTVSYLMDVAAQAGIETVLLRIDDIGWDAERSCFVDLDGQPIRSIFKLYPWEWLLRDPYAPQLLSTYTLTQWIEPIWKMLLSNKGILPILWEMFPEPSEFTRMLFQRRQEIERLCEKTSAFREGANLTIRRGGSVEETTGPYGAEGFVYQEARPHTELRWRLPVLGSWFIDGVAAGIGIRESSSPVPII